MIPTNVIPFPETQYSMHCGVCPKCSKSDGFLNLGKEHWFICRDHKTKWFAGINLFESWKDQTVVQTENIAVMLDSYKEVVPLRNIEEEHKISNTAK